MSGSRVGDGGMMPGRGSLYMAYREGFPRPAKVSRTPWNVGPPGIVTSLGRLSTPAGRSSFPPQHGKPEQGRFLLRTPERKV